VFDPGGEEGNSESVFGCEQVTLVEPALGMRGERDGFAVREMG